MWLIQPAIWQNMRWSKLPSRILLPQEDTLEQTVFTACKLPGSVQLLMTHIAPSMEHRSFISAHRKRLLSLPLKVGGMLSERYHGALKGMD